VSVLRGEVPGDLLRDKLLLVGATAPGLGDQTLTPNARIRGVLPGVEVHANAIDNLLHERNVSVLSPLVYAAWTLVPLWIALWLLVRMAHHALPIAFGLAAACLLVSVVAMFARHWWLPPAAPILGLVFLYLLWSWRRLESQFAYLRERAQALDALPAGAFEVLPRAGAPIADPMAPPQAGARPGHRTRPAHAEADGRGHAHHARGHADLRRGRAHRLEQRRGRSLAGRRVLPSATTMTVQARCAACPLPALIAPMAATPRAMPRPAPRRQRTACTGPRACTANTSRPRRACSAWRPQPSAPPRRKTAPG
jgi:hypothetical protein